MTRTITVKGTGRVTTAPDLIMISITLKTTAMDYEKTLALSAQKIDALNTALEEIGFEKKSVKTTNFNVYTDYKSVKTSTGDYKSVFIGYVCSHRLKVEFDFDTKRLAQTLSAISTCLAEPEFSIAFTVKNPSAINEELLRSATANAKANAQILCDAADVTLGELLSIDYTWGEIDIVSRTDYILESKCMSHSPMALADMEIEPDDIDISDSATFVWEIR